MKRLGACVALILLGIGHHAAGATQSVSICADYDKRHSAMPEIAQAAFGRMGYAIQIRYTPWIRALKETTAGECDALLGTFYTKTRAETLAFSDPIGQVVISLLALKTSHIHYRSLPDLKPYRIGVILGVAISPEFDTADFLHKDQTSSVDQNLSKLELGRIDLIAYKEQELTNAIKQHHPKLVGKVEVLSPPLNITPTYCTFSKKSVHYQKHMAAFNQGLQRIRRDGTYASIIRKYAVPF